MVHPRTALTWCCCHRPPCRHGLSPLQDTSNKSLDQYKQRAIASGALAGEQRRARQLAQRLCLTRPVISRAVHLAPAYYKPEFPRQDVQREHREWNKGLVNAVDHVIVEQEGVNQCFELLLNSLRDFADNADSGRNPGKAHLARLFFRCVGGWRWGGGTGGRDCPR